VAKCDRLKKIVWGGASSMRAGDCPPFITDGKEPVAEFVLVRAGKARRLEA
jgi:hypothetical protein